ncbi:hypothetical protein M406DRAFT_357558 [Cryphonectria parasitica EP155]|uniref:Uncharacterized protein n=1 Tax=Cryphonectria parasitica (strain ATCC 38755 / EP155) TaxID=660469 RepID=A0A9P4XXP9_CRYP1|nr:uncharacterized protein M406DRAFT_357558 [Cryphonectria parasitica EP155]KAF3762702.1 hypothetical protein M406DRAFT_357558 [Cryphonectria parasitica EP155]
MCRTNPEVVVGGRQYSRRENQCGVAPNRNRNRLRREKSNLKRVAFRKSAIVHPPHLIYCPLTRVRAVCGRGICDVLSRSEGEKV